MLFSLNCVLIWLFQCEYFNYQNLDKGLEHIKAAASSGHEGASYVLSIILVCENHNVKQGMKLLKNIVITSSSTLRQCREKFENTMKHYWRNKKLEPYVNHCKMKDEDMKKKGSGWLSESERAEEIKCEDCRCHWEVTYVCNWLEGWRKYKYY